MDYKKELQKHFSNENDLLQSRYNSSKNVFIYTSMLFFLNYFFIGAKFYDNFFSHTLAFMYILFIISLGVYTYFFFKKRFDFKKNNTILLTILIFIFGIVLLLPITGLNF